MFLLVLSTIFTLLYFSSQLEISKPAKKSFWLVSSFIFFLVAALQYNVGADYFSYRYIYETGHTLHLFERDMEYFTYYLFTALREFKLGTQSPFIAFAAINTITFFIMLKCYERHHMKAWLVFFLFMAITGIYHNQLNGLRQYIAVFLFPLLIVLLKGRHYAGFSFGFLISFFSHSSFKIVLPLVFISKIRVEKKYILITFILSFFLYWKVIPVILGELVSDFAENYAHYLDSEIYSAGKSFSSLLTKLYYLPLYILFFIFYLKDDSYNQSSPLIKSDSLFSTCILIWSGTYWMMFLVLEIGLIERIYQYFSFFYIFPIYYLLDRFLKQNYIVLAGMIILYVLIPYILKVTVLAVGEYQYQSIIFNG